MYGVQFPDRPRAESGSRGCNATGRRDFAFPLLPNSGIAIPNTVARLPPISNPPLLPPELAGAGIGAEGEDGAGVDACDHESSSITGACGVGWAAGMICGTTTGSAGVVYWVPPEPDGQT